MTSKDLRFRRPEPFPFFNGLLALVALAPVILAAAACTGDGDGKPNERPDRRRSLGAASLSDEELETKIGPQVQAFCASCHPLPLPEHAPRESWPHEVEDGFKFYEASGRTDTRVPQRDAVIEYYQRRAVPEAEMVPPAGAGAPAGAVAFARRDVGLAALGTAPAVAGLDWIALDPDGPAVLVSCDMRTGSIDAISFVDGEPRTTSLARLANPCRVAVCDLDVDGRRDLVVADLGNFFPTDEAVGRVVWLRRRDEGLAYESIVLLEGLGRVADVRPGDFDGDGDTDLVVAEFGWQTLGSIRRLVNTPGPDGMPVFESRTIDSRHGTIVTPTAHLDGDGRLDFVALISQEFEAVEAFLNQGDGKFRRERIYTGPHPSYGSSNIELIDLDGDGDLDVSYANGDGFDRGYLKPYHAVQWLENTGSFPFTHRLLGLVPGAHRAAAGDLDGDGDLDVAAVSLLPAKVRETYGGSAFDAIVWFEQTTPGEFTRHSLETQSCDHAALAVADFDGDGRVDLAVGNFAFGEDLPSRTRPSLVLWMQEDATAGSLSSASAPAD